MTDHKHNPSKRFEGQIDAGEYTAKWDWTNPSTKAVYVDRATPIRVETYPYASPTPKCAHDFRHAPNTICTLPNTEEGWRWFINRSVTPMWYDSVEEYARAAWWPCKGIGYHMPPYTKPHPSGYCQSYIDRDQQQRIGGLVSLVEQSTGYIVRFGEWVEKLCCDHFYRTIFLKPISSFFSDYNAMLILFHEAYHATCHLEGREYTTRIEYMREEIRAELAANMLAMHFNIPQHLCFSMAYISNWINSYVDTTHTAKKRRIVKNLLGEARKGAEIVAQESIHVPQF